MGDIVVIQQLQPATKLSRIDEFENLNPPLIIQSTIRQLYSKQEHILIIPQKRAI